MLHNSKLESQLFHKIDPGFETWKNMECKKFGNNLKDSGFYARNRYFIYIMITLGMLPITQDKHGRHIY